MPTEKIKKEKKVSVPHTVREHKSTVVSSTKKEISNTKSDERYFEGVGRRKTSIARVRMFPGNGNFTVNGKKLKEYFVSTKHQNTAIAPLNDLKLVAFDVTAIVSGGGIHAQAEAIRLGLSRAIILKSPEWKKRLHTVGFLTRDSRMVERKKYGLKKARRAPQWAKR
jgi:small subunit ribosomal protein S9